MIVSINITAVPRSIEDLVVLDLVVLGGGGSCEFDTRLRWTFFSAYFRLSPLLKYVRKVVGDFGKKVVLVPVWESQETQYALPTNNYDMILNVKMALNPNTSNILNLQFGRIIKFVGERVKIV